MKKTHVNERVSSTVMRKKKLLVLAIGILVVLTVFSGYNRSIYVASETEPEIQNYVMLKSLYRMLFSVILEGGAESQDFVAHYRSLRSNPDLMPDDDFFRTNYLISFSFEQPSTALNYKVADVLSNGDIILMRNLSSELAVFHAISRWTITIELDNNFAPDEFRVVFPNPDRWWASEPVPVTIYRRDVLSVDK